MKLKGEDFGNCIGASYVGLDMSVMRLTLAAIDIVEAAIYFRLTLLAALHMTIVRWRNVFTTRLREMKTLRSTS
jgi:hypothetical protein